MHAHFEQVEWGPIYLAAGVTTVRDCGNEFEFITAVRDAIAQGRGLGPRLLLAGFVDGTSPMAIGTARADTPEQARMWIEPLSRCRIPADEDLQLSQTGRTQSSRRRGPPPRHDRHRPRSGRTNRLPGDRGWTGPDQSHPLHRRHHASAPARQRHARRPPECRHRTSISIRPRPRKLWHSSRTITRSIDPTHRHVRTVHRDYGESACQLRTRHQQDCPQNSPSHSPTWVRQTRTPKIGEKIFQKEVAIVGALHRAGIPIVAGTDQAVPGHSLHRELELYVQAGFTPMEAIQAATTVPARVMGLDKELGHDRDRASAPT